MAKFLMRSAIALVALSASLVLLVTGFGMAKSQGWLSPFGIESERQDTQVIQAVNRVQEVALLSLAIEGVTQQKENADLLGFDIPGTGKVVIVKHGLTAKLGIDGEGGSISKTGENTDRGAMPEVKGIGYSDPAFELAVSNGGILSWAAPDISQTDMVNDVFEDAAQQKYLETNKDLLKDQARVFYNSLITSIDPLAETTFKFQD